MLPSHGTNRRPRRSAFTLIELLTVLAIIGVLAALLVPTIGAVRSKARSSQCRSNLRQIALALTLYANENRGLFPVAGEALPFTPGVAAAANRRSWTEQIFSQAGGQASVFRCPESSIDFAPNAQWSYFLSCHAAVAATGVFGAVRLDRIQQPARHLLVGDSAYGFVAEDADKDDYTQNAAFGITPAPFHGGRVNLAFVDTHVESAERFDKARFAIRYEGTGYDY